MSDGRVSEGQLTNVGRIQHLKFPIPANGGMVIFQGRNGIGKSTALSALDSAVRGEGKLNVRDGAESASVDFLGVNIRASKKTRHSGCLQVDSLEGKFSIADIIDPGYADPVVNDRHAILAILQVAGTKSDFTEFANLVGGEAQFKKLVKKDTLNESDFVAMAARVKRDFDENARDAKADADAKAEEIARLKSSIPADVKEPEMSASEIQLRLEHARINSVQAHTLRASYLKDIERYETNTKEFQALGSAVDYAKKLQDTEEEVRKSEENEQSCRATVERLRSELRQAETDLQIAEHKSSAARTAKTEAENSCRFYKELESKVKEAKPVEYPESAVELADAAVVRLQDELANAQRWEIAQDIHLEIKSITSEMNACNFRSEALRDAAKEIDTVVSEKLKRVSDKIVFDNDRLVVYTDRGKTFFNDVTGTNGLSKGERTKIAMDIAAEAVGEGGIVIVPQEYAQHLDEVALQEVANHAHARKITVFTALHTLDDEINTRVL